MSNNELTEGWGRLWARGVYHYIRDEFALCGTRAVRLGMPDLIPYSAHKEAPTLCCSTCSKAINLEVSGGR